MKTMKTLLATLCILPALALAQESRPYTFGPVTAVSYIKVKPGHFDEYMQHLGGTYRKQMQAFQKAGLVLDYKVYAATPRTPADPDVILTVVYPNYAALDKNADFDALSQQVAGTITTQNKAYGDRGAIREVLGGMLTQEIILK
ncbi:MAG TPA: hypothetical protein VKR38_16845 [Usitatibacter sp.]|nr:hypothetical protein [Usitatibacter sp.]